MIIGSYDPYKIGEIVTGTYERHRNELFTLTVLILREANENEWEDYRKNQGFPSLERLSGVFYYEVSTD